MPAPRQPSPKQVVLFDLDGTISDSAGGILSSLRAAFADHGVGWVDSATAQSLLGPPFSHSLPALVGHDRMPGVLEAYRRHYVENKALLSTSIFAGVQELLEKLATQPLRLAVATSKPEPHALEILAHLGLAEYFETIGGDTLDGKLGSKALVVGEVLSRLGDPDPDSVLMVGDRSHDVLGAAAHGVKCAGVLWGYGGLVELTEAGAWALLSHPDELLELLG